MKFFLAGIALGVVLNLLLFTEAGGTEIYSYDFMPLNEIESGPEMFSSVTAGPDEYTLHTSDVSALVSGTGEIKARLRTGGIETAFSGDGRHYIVYEKTGREIEFRGINGLRYWKLKSMEYPSLSYSGRLIFLMNGDHSKIRVTDHNGSETGARALHGRLCTVVAFADKGDAGAAGFLDGSYYFINSNGGLVYRGSSGEGMMVKSIAISPDANFGAVHCGGTEKDFAVLHDFAGQKSVNIPLEGRFRVKTSLLVNNEGLFSILDSNAVKVFSANGRQLFQIGVPSFREGVTALKENSGLFLAAFAEEAGGSRFIVFDSAGAVLFSGHFSGESFLTGSIGENSIFLRGSDNLFLYHYRRKGA